MVCGPSTKGRKGYGVFPVRVLGSSSSGDLGSSGSLRPDRGGVLSEVVGGGVVGSVIIVEGEWFRKI